MEESGFLGSQGNGNPMGMENGKRQHSGTLCLLPTTITIPGKAVMESCNPGLAPGFTPSVRTGFPTPLGDP